MEHILFMRGAPGADTSSPGQAISNQTTHVIWELALQNSVQSRTSIMLLSAFNVASAAMVLIIGFYDARRLAKNSFLHQGKKTRLLDMVHPADVLPLSLSVAIIVQGLIFLTVQGIGLHSVLVDSCRAIGQLVFPAIWSVGFTLLVFGIEMLYRGLCKNRFAPRGRWNTSVCWAVVLFMLLMIWVPTTVRKARQDECPGSLLSFALPWSDVAFGITLALIISYVAIGAILMIQLLRTAMVEQEERIAASRMVYYLVVATLLFSLVIPLWIQATFYHRFKVTLMMATVILNMFGIMIFFLQLLFRISPNCMSIPHAEMPWNRGIRDIDWEFLEAKDVDFKQHTGSSLEPRKKNDHPRFDRSFSTKSIEKQERTSGDASAKKSFIGKLNTQKSLPPPPLRKTAPDSTRNTMRKSQYSVFPTNESAWPIRAPPSMVFDNRDENELLPPKPPFSRGHHRNSSDASMATVQIGLRLSNVGPSATDLTDQNQLDNNPQNAFYVPSGLRDASARMSAQSLDVPVALKPASVFDRNSKSQGYTVDAGPNHQNADRTRTVSKERAGKPTSGPAATKNSSQLLPQGLQKRDGSKLRPKGGLVLEVQLLETSIKDSSRLDPENIAPPGKTYRYGRP